MACQATNPRDFLQSTDELTVAVEDLLNSLTTKFAGVTNELFAKSTCSNYMYLPYLGYFEIRTDLYGPTVDDMSKRLDNLEAALKANNESNTPGSPSKPQ